MREIKTAVASTSLEVWVHCPYCDSYQDQTEELHEPFAYGELSSETCHAEIICEDCKKEFIVTSIQY